MLEAKLTTRGRLQFSVILVWLSFIATAGSADYSPNYNLDLSFGGDFTLTDHNGEEFSLQDARGKVVLIYFGFTSCSDTCPTTLYKVSLAMKELGELAEFVQPIFVTVDTKRDTPEVIRKFVPYFHPSMIGLTGTQDEVEAVAKQYRTPVLVRKPDENGYYVVDHGSRLFIVDTKGTLANILFYETTPEKMAENIRALLADRESDVASQS